MAAKVTPEKAEKTTPDEDMVSILIPRDPMRREEEYLPVGVNGKIMLIPYGKKVEIPKSYAQAIDLANAMTSQAIEYELSSSLENKNIDG